MESSWCFSNTLQKGSCPYAPLDKALRYACESWKRGYRPQRWVAFADSSASWDHITNEEVRKQIQQSIRPFDHSQKTQTEVVWTCSKVKRACQDNLTRHSAGTESKRQTKKEMGGQLPRMDRPETGWGLEKGRGQGGMEDVGFEVFCGAWPNGLADFGICHVCKM